MFQFIIDLGVALGHYTRLSITQETANIVMVTAAWFVSMSIIWLFFWCVGENNKINNMKQN